MILKTLVLIIGLMSTAFLPACAVEPSNWMGRLVSSEHNARTYVLVVGEKRYFLDDHGNELANDLLGRDPNNKERMVSVKGTLEDNVMHVQLLSDVSNQSF